MQTEVTSQMLTRAKYAVHQRPIRVSYDYQVDGEPACRETFLSRKGDGSGYVIGHDDYLEKFVDVPDLHFKYERHEFEDLALALAFLIQNYPADAIELLG